MGYLKQIPISCFAVLLAAGLLCLTGCDLGTYSKRSNEFLKSNPAGKKSSSLYRTYQQSQRWI